MKNEKDFKNYISEIAAKIAEAPADTRRLRSYQARKDKGAAVSVSDKYQGIKYRDVPGLSGLMKRKADQIVAALEEDLMDQVKTASIYPSKGRYENSIIFKIEFENLPTFVGIVSADPEDLPEPKGVTGFNPPISSGPRKDDVNESVFNFLSEVLRNEPIVKAGFASQAVTNDAGKFLKRGSMQDLESNTAVSPKTKKMINVFLQDLGKELLSIGSVPGTSVQKTLDTIKKKAKVANKKSKIAEQDGPNTPPKPDAKKLADILKDIAVVKSALFRIDDAIEFGDFLMGIMPMLKLDPSQFINGLNKAVKLAAELKQKNNPSEPVSKDSPNAMYDKMPVPSGLKEAYERIKRK